MIRFFLSWFSSVLPHREPFVCEQPTLLRDGVLTPRSPYVVLKSGLYTSPMSGKRGIGNDAKAASYESGMKMSAEEQRCE